MSDLIVQTEMYSNMFIANDFYTFEVLSRYTGCPPRYDSSKTTLSI